MWIKVDDRLYNADDFSEIYQRTNSFTGNSPWEVTRVYAISRSSGEEIMLSATAALPDIAEAIKNGENLVEVCKYG